MDLENLLRGVKARAPWIAVGRPMLLAAGITIHRGYDETIGSALAADLDGDVVERLSDALTEHLVAGEKLIRLVKLAPGERAKVEAWAKAKRRTSNVLTDAFPGMASLSDIRTFKDTSPQSLGSVELVAGHAALYTGARSYLTRVEVPQSKLKPGAADGYEKLIGIQRIHVQTYDAIWVPKSGNYACITTDLPKGVPTGFATESQVALEVHLRKVLGRSLDIYNLWPAVDGLYATKDGRLVDYGFATDDESVKHHTARRGSKCLREDAYDKAGAHAVGDALSPFKIAMAWTIAAKDEHPKAEPELILPGVAALLNHANATLDHAVVRNCLTTRDLDFVASKLLPHLK